MGENDLKGKRKKETPVPEKERPIWVKHLKKGYHSSSRPCRHALIGHINAPKFCSMDYECYHCPYDQMLDDLDLVGLTEAPSYTVASGFQMANGYYYHLGHSWARFEHGGRIMVGFDDFLVKLFGPAQIMELPPLGAILEQDQVGWAFGRDGHKAVVLSPVTGVVIEVNHAALDHPEMTHKDPYHEGWLIIFEADLPKKNMKRLFFGKESLKWIEQERQELMNLMGTEHKQLVAKRDEPIDDVFGRFPEIGWDQLVRTFLRTEKI